MTIRFNWGTGIALSYTAFALGTSAFVAFAMGRPVDLVSADYYARSLQLDRRIEAERNAASLGTRLSVEDADGRVRVTLPSDLAAAATGSITLYRASDARADRTLPLVLDASGSQEVSLAGLTSGYWLLQLEWTARGARYYTQRPVVVP